MSVYWFVLPLAVAISLVYAASRHESWSRIWRHATRLFVTILLILGAATLVLMGINSLV
jgi:membrane-anchored glycerophosphoryl diester phosphodiesterase (GDPDase)